MFDWTSQGDMKHDFKTFCVDVLRRHTHTRARARSSAGVIERTVFLRANASDSATPVCALAVGKKASESNGGE